MRSTAVSRHKVGVSRVREMTWIGFPRRAWRSASFSAAVPRLAMAVRALMAQCVQ